MLNYVLIGRRDSWEREGVRVKGRWLNPKSVGYDAEQSLIMCWLCHMEGTKIDPDSNS